MLFHAKALEIYSQAFNELTSIDEEEHIEVRWRLIRFLIFT